MQNFMTGVRRGVIFLMAAGLLAEVSCENSVPPVPPSGRKVVEPRGSSDVTKPWNHTTEREGEAILGPLSNMRR